MHVGHREEHRRTGSAVYKWQHRRHGTSMARRIRVTTVYEIAVEDHHATDQRSPTGKSAAFFKLVCIRAVAFDWYSLEN